jgi:hypothetical protein
MVHRILTACVLSACFALPASAGAGSPVVGTWEMKISCKGSTGGAPSSRKATINVLIADSTPDDLQADVGGAMIGYVLYETAKPERARITLVGCGVSSLNGLLIQASGKVTPEKASLKGTATFLSVSTESTEQCTAKLVRTNTTEPVVPGCT